MNHIKTKQDLIDTIMPIVELSDRVNHPKNSYIPHLTADQVKHYEDFLMSKNVEKDIDTGAKTESIHDDNWM